MILLQNLRANESTFAHGSVFDFNRDYDRYKKVVGYVTPGEKAIRLTPLFFERPLSGADSSSGTLVHEMSHQLPGAYMFLDGFRDYHNATDVYGVVNSEALARQRPDLAVKHADSLQFYGEQQ